MKHNLILSAVLLMVSMMSFAQRLDITLEDNSIVSYDVKRIKSLEFMACHEFIHYQNGGRGKMDFQRYRPEAD